MMESMIKKSSHFWYNPTIFACYCQQSYLKNRLIYFLSKIGKCRYNIHIVQSRNTKVGLSLNVYMVQIVFWWSPHWDSRAEGM